MITTFKIADQNAILLAKCVSVPSLMIIYEQNGVGKSTLLHTLKYNISKNFADRKKLFTVPLLTGLDHLTE